MEDFLKFKAIKMEELKKMNLSHEISSLINAVSSNEFVPVINLIDVYENKRAFYANKYKDNDVRVMFFTKILNAAYSYQLERILINGLVDNDEKTRLFINNTGLSQVMNNWNTFKIAHNHYNAFTFYIRIFSCLESSIRKLIASVNAPQGFKPLSKICEPFISTLNPDYKALIELLSTIRNLMHTLGFPLITKEIEYKKIIYKFEENKLPEPKILNLINLLDLFEKDVLQFIEDLFNLREFQNINFIEDDFSSDLSNLESWLKK